MLRHLAAMAKIDVHHHILPDFYQDVLAQANIPVGTPIPKWSPEASLKTMDALHIGTSILSLSAPGAMIAGDPPKVRALARQWNEYAASIRVDQPDRFGFFGALPGLTDMQGAIAEIKHTLDHLDADGITLFTSYDGKYLGAKEFEPIWAELDRRRAVVHIHPVHSRGAPFTSPFLPQPLIDFPHESTRTASDLVLSGRKRQYPNCKIILSHAGGTLPYISERLVALGNSIFASTRDDNSPRGDQIMDDLKTFYFDLAISGSANVLDTLLKWAPPHHILYGSDFPFAGGAEHSFDSKLENYIMDVPLRQMCYRDNALTLLPRLGSLEVPVTQRN
ncbi:MAG: hypothetical protein LQ348_003850 [Seirophora lacunosa]|nr:MAG: hypothetical protein LQ348_003850 [Seirophora lacunosa]